MIFPPGSRTTEYGKWSPNWEGPFVVKEVKPNGVYELVDEQGELQVPGVNARFLKKYYSAIGDR